MANDTLWAPWRLAYIKDDAPKIDGCFLCHYVRHPDDDARNLVVARGERVIVVLNRYPYNNGHLLVAPNSHQATLGELDDAVMLETQQWLRTMCDAITQTMNAEGFNIGLNLGRVAGAGLPGHLHWHIVPRWNGDTNFMPTLGGVKVIPQALDALHELLTDALRQE